MNKEVMRGVDISVHNGSIDFEKIKNKYDFVILRCGYGSDYENQDDENFERNASECQRLGIPFGVYLYSYADTKEKALSEAYHVLRLIEDKTLLCGVWYDVEDKIMPDNKKLLSEICVIFLEAIENEGYYAGIYATLHWFKNRLDLEMLKPYDKWVAQWNESDDFDHPHGMWQYTSKGKIEGLKGDFDLNVAYKNYPDIIKRMMAANKTDEIFTVQVNARGGLNVRRGPGTNYAIISALSDGSRVNISGTVNGWGKLENGGYISLNYTEKIEGKKEYRVNSPEGLKVFPNANTSQPPLCILANNSPLSVNNLENGFAEIEIKGYIETDKLKIS